MTSSWTRNWNSIPFTVTMLKYSYEIKAMHIEDWWIILFRYFKEIQFIISLSTHCMHVYLRTADGRPPIQFLLRGSPPSKTASETFKCPSNLKFINLWISLRETSTPLYYTLHNNVKFQSVWLYGSQQDERK